MKLKWADNEIVDNIGTCQICKGRKKTLLLEVKDVIIEVCYDCNKRIQKGLIQVRIKNDAL